MKIGCKRTGGLGEMFAEVYSTGSSQSLGEEGVERVLWKGL